MATKKSRSRTRNSAKVHAMPRELRAAAKLSRPTSRHSIHKTRGRWFQARAAWPRREPDVGHLIAQRARARESMPAHAAATQWVPVGPTNIGGRMTSIVCHPTDADHIWAGSAGGGVWESTDAGLTWRSVWHQEASLNVGSLAIDPQDPGRIYCGTGEANLSADSYAGAGVYLSTDGGATWDHLADAQTESIPTRIGALAVDPFDSDHVVLGGIAFGNSPPSGFYDSTDGGQSWTRRRVTGLAGAAYWCHSIVFDPEEQDVLFTAVTERGARSGIYKSTDGGSSWTHLTAGLPSPFAIHRSSLAIAPGASHIVYALIAAAADDGNSVLGVFRTNNRGATWTEVGRAREFADERQMSYNNTIAVHPQDPDRVIWGGVDLHRTIDGGNEWYQVTHWFEARGNPHYAHADHHALLIPAADPDRIYDVNDGGLDVSFDRGRSWTNRSLGLPITMYYDMDVSQANGDLFGGGAQDNGTPITVTGSADDHFDVTGGDGGWLVFDPNDVNHIVASIYNMNIFRFTATLGWREITPRGRTQAEEELLAEERNSIWMAFIAMHPFDRETYFTGSQRVWRTEDDGENWQPVSASLDDSPISAIAIARSDPSTVFVGTENGGIWRSRDGGDTWQGNLAGGMLSGAMVTRLAVKPDDEGVVFATVANMGHSHVFRSDDGGNTWSDVDGGELPDVPFHALAMPLASPETVFACGDAGVFVSTDLGATWQDLSGNLPTAMVVDLVYQEQDRTLTAATYGRSLWRVQL